MQRERERERERVVACLSQERVVWVVGQSNAVVGWRSWSAERGGPISALGPESSKPAHAATASYRELSQHGIPSHALNWHQHQQP